MALKSFSTLSQTISTLFHQHSQFAHASSSPAFVSILFPKSTSTSASPSPTTTCIIHEPSHKDMQLLSPCFSKRKLNLALLLNAFLWGVLPPILPDHALLLAQELDLELQRYTDSKEGFTLLTPSSWTKVKLLLVFEL